MQKDMTGEQVLKAQQAELTKCQESFEELQNYLMTSCQTPGSRIDHELADEEKGE